MKNFPTKFLRATIMSGLFIMLGFYLIQKEETLPKMIGYANIVFWIGLWLVLGIRAALIASKKNKLQS